MCGESANYMLFATLTFDLPVLLVCCDNCEGFSFPLAINMALTLAAASAAASRLLLLPGPVAFCMIPGPPTQFLEQNQIEFEPHFQMIL